MPFGCEPSRPVRKALALETNHEQTLYVRYVFCNHLISRQQIGFSRERIRPASRRQPQDGAWRAGGGRRGKRRSDYKRLCRSEICEQRTVLVVYRRGNQYAILALLEPCAQIVLAGVVGGKIPPEDGGFRPVVQFAAARQRPNQWHHE